MEHSQKEDTDVKPSRLVQRKWSWAIRKSRKGISICQHYHLFVMRYVAPHVALVDHIRYETLRLFRRNLHAANPQRTVEHCHGNAVAFFRYNPAERQVNIAGRINWKLAYTLRNNPRMQISRAFSSVSQTLRSTKRRSFLSRAASKLWMSPFRIAEIKGA